MSLEAKRRSEIEALHQLWKKAFGSRHGKYDFYEYLEGVWKLYLRWKADGKSQARKKQLASLYNVKLRKNTHPIRAIIDASSEEEDAGVKSRWTKALLYGLKNRAQVKLAGFKKFLHNNGGPAGCSSLGAVPRAAKKRKLRST